MMGREQVAREVVRFSKGTKKKTTTTKEVLA